MFLVNLTIDLQRVIVFVVVNQVAAVPVYITSLSTLLVNILFLLLVLIIIFTHLLLISLCYVELDRPCRYAGIIVLFTIVFWWLDNFGCGSAVKQPLTRHLIQSHEIGRKIKQCTQRSFPYRQQRPLGSVLIRFRG